MINQSIGSRVRFVLGFVALEAVGWKQNAPNQGYHQPLLILFPEEPLDFADSLVIRFLSGRDDAYSKYVPSNRLA